MATLLARGRRGNCAYSSSKTGAASEHGLAPSAPATSIASSATPAEAATSTSKVLEAAGSTNRRNSGRTDLSGQLSELGLHGGVVREEGVECLGRHGHVVGDAGGRDRGFLRNGLPGTWSGIRRGVQGTVDYRLESSRVGCRGVLKKPGSHEPKTRSP
ncbi:hypothetical protein K466DRAFT_46727 [Polyporus arcularius HHB13444]|uniref:Uncharacterized protein n=1 Tax=Polyporus arcularius HHB13444 TaxID=1314778 RepID=A0A5C3NRB7_9APHY|nr:hypothetical protein K466DRAFT_46727 [Polyporus arcularius HHB13444]